ncbi:hypothetical protein RDI58_012371 [Solanum bulbocastanum]|uniref:Uncharacterized protein n=1 Tax=Solanum bulbocastanum TaxID=147425 RepID=A0AAN8TPP6_SOLBU
MKATAETQLSQCTNTINYNCSGSSSCQSFHQGENSLPMVAECLSKFTSSKEPQHHTEAKASPHKGTPHPIFSSKIYKLILRLYARKVSDYYQSERMENKG